MQGCANGGAVLESDDNRWRRCRSYRGRRLNGRRHFDINRIVAIDRPAALVTKSRTIDKFNTAGTVTAHTLIVALRCRTLASLSYSECYAPMSQPFILVLGNPAASHLKMLDRLPDSTHVVATADEAHAMEHAAEADVIVCDMGRAATLKALLPHATKLRWVHSVSAGVESLLFPEMLASPAILTNGRGAYKRSLAEFVIAGAMYFAKDMPRLLRNQQAGVWEPFYMEELHGTTLGIVGYGEIGHASAALAKALGMKVLALRRRPELSSGDPLVDRVYTHEGLREMLSQCDYILAAAPNAPGAIGLIGEAEFAVMKPNAVIMNVGRGPVIVESAMIQALESGRIRGAALDVFDHEPLPAGHAFYGMKNVLLSPHCADRVTGWLDMAVEVFLANFERFVKGEELMNIVDKKAGY
jgi:phosphoglycerate dehydrogenase-like enzyme